MDHAACRWLVLAPSDATTIQALREGRLTLRDALSRSWNWLAQMGDGELPVHAWEIEATDVPEEHWPAPVGGSRRSGAVLVGRGPRSRERLETTVERPSKQSLRARRPLRSSPARRSGWRWGARCCAADLGAAHSRNAAGPRAQAWRGSSKRSWTLSEGVARFFKTQLDPE